MTIRTWDFEDCPKCGTKHNDQIFDGERIPSAIECKKCRSSGLGWATRKTNGIHTTHSSLYGRYEPGLGCVVDSYGHKQKLMRDMGVMEASDPVKGSRCHQKEEPPKMSQNNSTWMNESDLAKAQQEATDRASRGDFDITF